MKLLRAEPGEGIAWIRRAFQVFLRQPFGLAGLFSLCALVAFAVSWIPVVGGALLPVLAPAGSLVFMIATRRAVAGERPLPGRDRRRCSAPAGRAWSSCSSSASPTWRRAWSRC